MNRRAVLRALAIAPAVPALVQAAPLRSVASGGFRNAGVFRFSVGEYACHSIYAGVMTTSLRQPQTGPEESTERFAQEVARCTTDGRLAIPYNVLLLSRNGQHTLIDAGPGASDKAPCRVLEAIGLLGLSADDVSTVILTHAHFDHMGGLLDRQGKPVFARARHVVMAEERAFWTAVAPDFSRMRMGFQGMLKQARRVFELVPFETVGDRTEIVPGITAILTPGHTPGHMTLRIVSEGQSLCHIADTCHHGGILIQNPHWSLGSDVDGEQAIRSRLALFGEITARKERVFGFHLPFPGVGQIVRLPGSQGFCWLNEDGA